jgi:hypothetical protein
LDIFALVFSQLEGLAGLRDKIPDNLMLRPNVAFMPPESLIPITIALIDGRRNIPVADFNDYCRARCPVDNKVNRN